MAKMEKNRVFIGVSGAVAAVLTFYVLIKQTMLFGDLLLTTAIFLWLFFTVSFFLRKYISQLYRVMAIISFVVILASRLLFNQFDVRKVDDVSIWLLFITTFVAVVLFFSTNLYKDEDKIQKLKRAIAEFSKKKNVVFGLLVIILLVAIIQSTTRLGSRDFHNDEYYHVETAHGYLMTGEYIQWDFTKNRSQLDEDGEQLIYKRAWPLTWQVAQCIKIFGDSELSMRLPAVMWFIFFLILSYFVILRWRKDAVFAFFIVLTFAFFDHFILHSRLVRMYSMLLFFSTASIVTWLLLYKETVQKSLKAKRLLLYAGLALLTTVAAVIVHKIYLLFFPAFAVFVFVEFLYATAKSKKKGIAKAIMYRHIMWAALVAAIAIVGLLLNYMELVDLLRLVGVRNDVNFDYEITVFADFGIPLFALSSFIIGASLFLQKKDLAYRFIAIVPLSTILLFVFFLLRYNVIRYILFIIPFLIVIVSWFVYQCVLKWAAHLPGNTTVRMVVTLVTCVLLITPFSIPGVAPGSFLHIARADRTSDLEYGHDFTTAYNYIRSNRDVGEPVLTVSFRSYYWQDDKEVEVINLGSEKSLSLNDFKMLVSDTDNYWVIYAKGKVHHLKSKVKSYFADNCNELSASEQELQQTNIIIYHCE